MVVVEGTTTTTQRIIHLLYRESLQERGAGGDSNAHERSCSLHLRHFRASGINLCQPISRTMYVSHFGRPQPPAIRGNTMSSLIECVPNFSEGRDVSSIQALVAAMSDVPGAAVLDCHSDADHNRSVITLAGAGSR